MSDYLIINWKPKTGLDIQVRSSFEDALALVKSEGGYIVQAIDAAPQSNELGGERK